MPDEQPQVMCVLLRKEKLLLERVSCVLFTQVGFTHGVITFGFLYDITIVGNIHEMHHCFMTQSKNMSHFDVNATCIHFLKHLVH